MNEPSDSAASRATAASPAQGDFRRWTDCLLDPSGAPGEHRAAAQRWCAWAFEALGIDEDAVPGVDDGFVSRTWLPTGLAISPRGAARCVREYRRTAVFLQGMDAAIGAARARFPGETIHVLEAGCGPLAALSLPFAVRYPPEEVSFTLLDLHPASLEGARRLAGILGVARSIRACIAADATAVRFAESERPHVIGCEVLLRALSREPQVAATMNLAPQLRPGGCFVPQQIRVDAGLWSPSKQMRMIEVGTSETGSAVHELGPVFCLDAAEVAGWRRLAPRTLSASAIDIPPHDARKTPLHLLTRIQVFGPHRLGDFDCSLNLPQPVKIPRELAERGGVAEFDYEISAQPGLRLRSRARGARRDS